jgi:hypothetical protein
LFRHISVVDPAPIKYFFLSKYFKNPTVSGFVNKTPLSVSFPTHPVPLKSYYRPHKSSSFFISGKSLNYTTNPKLSSGFISNTALSPLMANLKNFK